MLIDFQVTNYRAIRGTQGISLVASSKRELEDTNTFNPPLAGFRRLLRSAVIYGPNASGKTTLLRALQFMQEMVLKSAIESQRGQKIVHTPFKLSSDTKSAPSEFAISFVEDDTRYEYGFSISAERIHDEWLIAHPHGRARRIFERVYNERNDSYVYTFGSTLRGDKSVWQEATRPNALFLSTAIQLNSELLLPVFRWFQSRLVVVVGGTSLNQTLSLRLLEQDEGKRRVLEMLHAADLSITDLNVRYEQTSGLLRAGQPLIFDKPSPEGVARIVRITSFHKSVDTEEQVGFNIDEESSGTRALLFSAGAWINVLDNGEVLLFDELDTSLHPMMTRHLVSLFHAPDINKKNAQLVFTTHDTTLLDGELFRRDQIWFVEKDSHQASRTYPLSDFSTRKGEALERGYLRGRYGALPILKKLAR